jgi:hypothetical protein
MTEQECLAEMVAPGTRRPGKYREGVIQIWVTRACDKACFNCTQASNYAGNPGMISVAQFRNACRSLRGYFGVVGMFGGNPAVHPRFEELCAVMREEVPIEQRGIWSNNPMTIEKARIMRETFNPFVSNLNVHLDRKAHDMFKEGWPECGPVGLTTDSRHSPVFVAMKDVLRRICDACGGGGKIAERLGALTCPRCDGVGRVVDESRIWELISGCDINQHWSAMIGVFRGQLRAWFCEVAGAQSMLHQDEPGYLDTGIDPTVEHFTGRKWWELPMQSFVEQVRKHCFDCGVPLRGYGELAQSEKGSEQTSATHAAVAFPKRRDRLVQVVKRLEQLEVGRLQRTTRYLQNALK